MFEMLFHSKYRDRNRYGSASFYFYSWSLRENIGYIEEIFIKFEIER